MIVMISRNKGIMMYLAIKHFLFGTTFPKKHTITFKWHIQFWKSDRMAFEPVSLTQARV